MCQERLVGAVASVAPTLAVAAVVATGWKRRPCACGRPPRQYLAGKAGPLQEHFEVLAFLCHERNWSAVDSRHFEVLASLCHERNRSAVNSRASSQMQGN
mmetsp:Transcript_6038/g.11240  ORF Transcript_6038/g.11240 Transcript_6038/m.11240 type:complete len:100 (+) Transcript_6038:896-1195(+)